MDLMDSTDDTQFGNLRYLHSINLNAVAIQLRKKCVPLKDLYAIFISVIIFGSVFMLRGILSYAVRLIVCQWMNIKVSLMYGPYFMFKSTKSSQTAL